MQIQRYYSLSFIHGMGFNFYFMMMNKIDIQHVRMVYFSLTIGKLDSSGVKRPGVNTFRHYFTIVARRSTHIWSFVNTVPWVFFVPNILHNISNITQYFKTFFFDCSLTKCCHRFPASSLCLVGTKKCKNTWSNHRKFKMRLKELFDDPVL